MTDYAIIFHHTLGFQRKHVFWEHRCHDFLHTALDLIVKKIYIMLIYSLNTL